MYPNTDQGKQDALHVLTECHRGKDHKSPKWMNAFQVLNRSQYREEYKKHYGAYGGKGCGVNYAASSAVADILESLIKEGKVEVMFVDSVGSKFLVNDQWLEPGFEVIAYYRIV